MFWKVGKSQKPGPKTAAPPPLAQPAPRAASADRPNRTTLSVIGPGLTVFGTLHGASDIVIHGTVRSGVSGRTVTVGETATVEGGIVARSLRLLGACQGPVQTEAAVVGELARLGGDLACGGDVELMGEVTGNVTGRVITIAETAHLTGSVRGEAVHVRGKIHGNIEAFDVTIAASATIIGNITHNTLAMDKGATHRGLRPWRPRRQM